ncbi:MAG: hypothetical protein ABI315_06135, partial [Bacteroidia bacterium]
MQIKKLIVFIFLASFCSCSHKIDNKELEQSFLASISFSEYYNKLILAKFEKALSDHGSEPIEKYISKAKRVRKIVAAYSEDVYTFYYDSVSHKSIEELIKGYDSTIDSIKKSLPLYNNQDRFNSDRNIEMLKQITRINFLELK